MQNVHMLAVAVRAGLQDRRSGKHARELRHLDHMQIKLVDPLIERVQHAWTNVAFYRSYAPLLLAQTIHPEQDDAG